MTEISVTGILRNKNKRNIMIKKGMFILMLLVVMTVSISYAQGSSSPGGMGVDPSQGGGGYGPGVNDNPTGSVPFDGGLSLILLAAGAGLKVKRRTQNA